MSFDPVSIALDLGGKLIDRIWPDPAQAAAAKLKLFELNQSGELAHLAADTDLVKGQLAVNAAEAANTNIFVAGWRPAVGWVCAAGLFSQFIVRPFFMFVANLIHISADFPTLDMGTLLTLLAGMLGLGYMRTQEKLSGVSSGQ